MNTPRHIKLHCPVCREPIQLGREAVGYIAWCDCEVPPTVDSGPRGAVVLHAQNRAFDALFPAPEAA